jgi:hypothetical protein
MPPSSDIPRAWAPVPEPEPKPLHTSLPLSVKFLILAAVFFVIAGGVAAYFIFVGGRSVSTDNIIISVDGPVSISGGGTLQLLVTVENHNPVPISGASVEAVFPDGTRSADDVTQPYPRYDSDLGNLAAGEAVTRTVRAVMFGTEQQSVTIPITVQYQTANSNSTFEKEKDFVVKLTSSPVSVTPTSVTQIAAGQPLTFSVAVRSNAATPLSDIALLVNYPFGFNVLSTSVPATNGLFALGKLAPGEERDITISGTLNGSDANERVFRWSAGSTASSTNASLSVVYATADSSITITQPFLNIGLSLNGNNSDSFSVSAGQTIQGMLTWTNTLSSAVQNAVITLKFAGTALDPASVSTQTGFYQSSDGTLRFDRDTISSLANLAPGDTGTGEFSFAVKPGSALSGVKNPTVAISVSAAGSRTSESGVPETLTATVSKTLKVQSGLALASSVVRTVGAFENSGAWPPVAETPTTYTVQLSVANGVNPTAGAAVTMTLPSYVTFTNVTSPANGTISYNASARTVRWAIGDLGPNATAQGSFQISFLPSASQRGSSPTLVSSQTLTGTDRFTQSSVSATAQALTTKTTADPAYVAADGVVQ